MLDTKSTDAMHWAEELVNTAKKNGFTLEQTLDTGWLVGWFANFWAAVHDPLENRADAAESRNAELVKVIEGIMPKAREYFLTRMGHSFNTGDMVSLSRIIEAALEDSPGEEG